MKRTAGSAGYGPQRRCIQPARLGPGYQKVGCVAGASDLWQDLGPQWLCDQEDERGLTQMQSTFVCRHHSGPRSSTAKSCCHPILQLLLHVLHARAATPARSIFGGCSSKMGHTACDRSRSCCCCVYRVRAGAAAVTAACASWKMELLLLPLWEPPHALDWIQLVRSPSRPDVAWGRRSV